MEELEQKLKKQEDQIKKLEQGLKDAQRILHEHTHNGRDGSLTFRETVELPTGKSFDSGTSGWLGYQGNDQFSMTFATGPEIRDGVSDYSKNSQMSITHQDTSLGGRTFVEGLRSPLFSGTDGELSASTTFTQARFDFVSTEFDLLDDIYLVVYDIDGTFESRIISTLTRKSLVVTSAFTISGTGLTWFIYQPLYFGSAERPWKRLYTHEDSGGGVRFGTGVTATAGNALLYFKSGKLIIRWLDGNTTRYKYLNLSGTGVTWTHTTTAP